MTLSSTKSKTIGAGSCSIILLWLTLKVLIDVEKLTCVADAPPTMIRLESIAYLPEIPGENFPVRRCYAGISARNLAPCRVLGE